jgi:hypothetical protein
MSLELARHLVMRELGILEADDAAYRVRHISPESHVLLTWTQSTHRIYLGVAIAVSWR